MPRMPLWLSIPMLLCAPATLAGPAAGVELLDPWVRALPPGAPNTAAYVTVRNPGGETLQIVGASASIARRVEIHRTAEADGLVGMQRVQTVPLPAGGSVQLAPGGLHLMLLDLERMPSEGETVTLCLQFAAGGSACTEAPVRRGAADAHQHHGHH